MGPQLFEVLSYMYDRCDILAWKSCIHKMLYFIAWYKWWNSILCEIFTWCWWDALPRRSSWSFIAWNKQLPFWGLGAGDKQVLHFPLLYPTVFLGILCCQKLAGSLPSTGKLWVNRFQRAKLTQDLINRSPFHLEDLRWEWDRNGCLSTTISALQKDMWIHHSQHRSFAWDIEVWTRPNYFPGREFCPRQKATEVRFQ